MAAVGVLYIDEVQIGSGPDAAITNKTSYTITSTGITTSVSGVQWTYSGSNTFLGFSTTSGATTPDSILEVGDTGTFNDIVWEINGIHLYSVTSALPTFTGTKWLINSSPTLPSDTIGSVLTFRKGNTIYDGFDVPPTGIVYYYYGLGGEEFDEWVYTPSGGWTSDAARTITIFSEPNSELGAWLVANATQLPTPTYITSTSDLTSIADAIRSKGGTAASLTFPSGFVTAIGNINSKALTSYSASINPADDIYIDTSDIPVGDWDGFEYIDVECNADYWDGSVTITGDATIITFTVPVGTPDPEAIRPRQLIWTQTTLQAEEGMTWGEWIESEYNTVGFVVHGTYYIACDNGQGNYIISTTTAISQEACRITDTIVANFNYVKRLY